MLEPTVDIRAMRSLSASTREKDPKKKRKKRNIPVDITFPSRLPKIRPKKLKKKSQVDVIRKAAGNIEKASRPKSERHLPRSGNLGLTMNWEEAPYGGEHKARFVKAAIRDRLRRGDIDFGTKKGQHLGGRTKPKVRSFRSKKVREHTQTNQKGTQARLRDSFLTMGRHDLGARESLRMQYDRTSVDDVLKQFKTGTGKKPKSKRRRKITVYGNTRYE